MLELFEGQTYDWYDYKEIGGIVTSVPFATQVNFAAAKTRLDTILNDIVAGSDGRQAEILTILAGWYALAYKTYEIGAGGVQSATGIRINPTKTRQLYENRLRLLLGFNVYKHGFSQGEIAPGQRQSDSGGYNPR